jgi:hypothetical protein
MALPGSFVSRFATRSRFALTALFFLAASCAKDPLDFLPVGHLTSAQWATYKTVGAEVAAMSQECRVPLSRHGGAHRSADRPMGGVLVLPPEQRRVQVVEGFRRHLDAAAPLPFPLDSRLRASSLPDETQCAIRAALQKGPALAAFRVERMANMTALADMCRPVSIAINALMPPTVARIAANVNTCYMAALVDGVGHLDRDLVQRFVHGFPVVGAIPDSGVYRRVDPPDDPLAFPDRLAAFTRGARWYNARLDARLRARQWAAPDAMAADLAVATKSQSEASKGLIVGPYLTVPALHAALASHHPGVPPEAVYPRPMPRFGVPQKGSIRAIDDGKSSGHNAATQMVETVTTPHFVYPAVVARAVVVSAAVLGLQGITLTLALCDLRAAYRCIPTSQPWYTTIGFFDPSTNLTNYYWLPGHNFGLTAAVVNFNRYPELVVVVTRVMLLTPAEHYYDDFIVPDLRAGGGTGLKAVQSVILDLARGAPRHPLRPIRAPELDPDKTQPTSSTNVLLGVNADLTDPSAVVFSVNQTRCAAVLAMFQGAFHKRFLTPHLASQIRGKLYFLLSAAFAAVGRAATLPLVQRQYRDTNYAFHPGSELNHTMLFFEALLPRLPSLRVPVSPDTSRPLLVYTDASFFTRRGRGPRPTTEAACAALRAEELRGALGAVVYDPEDGTARFAAADPPWALLLSEWSTDRKTYIAELEALAAVSVYTTYPTLFAGRKVTHYIDNTVALSALVHGYAHKPELAKTVNVFYAQMLGLRTSVYFDWVPSKANIADLPSRGAFAHTRAELAGIPIVGDAPDLLIVPGVHSWGAPLLQWLDQPASAAVGLPL